MADPAQPMTDADVTPPPANASFQPAAPLKDQGVEFSEETSASKGDPSKGGASAAAPTEEVKQSAQRLTDQATDKARQFASQGKERATGALDQLTQLLNDAAGQVDDKLGQQYGQYAHQAAGAVSSFADQVRAKDVDELFDDVRELVRKSPAVAVGAAAAVGFVLARLVSAGIDERDA